MYRKRVTESIPSPRDSAPGQRRSTWMTRFPSQPVIEMLARGCRPLWESFQWPLDLSFLDRANPHREQFRCHRPKLGDIGRKFWPVPRARWGVRCCCQVNWLNLRGHAAPLWQVSFHYCLCSCRRGRGALVTECFAVVHRGVETAAPCQPPVPRLLSKLRKASSAASFRDDERRQ